MKGSDSGLRRIRLHTQISPAKHKAMSSKTGEMLLRCPPAWCTVRRRQGFVTPHYNLLYARQRPPTYTKPSVRETPKVTRRTPRPVNQPKYHTSKAPRRQTHRSPSLPAERDVPDSFFALFRTPAKRQLFRHHTRRHLFRRLPSPGRKSITCYSTAVAVIKTRPP